MPQAQAFQSALGLLDQLRDDAITDRPRLSLVTLE